MAGMVNLGADAAKRQANAPLQFKPVCSLKSHMDVIRGLQFLPGSETLLSASEDCTLKLWNLRGLKRPNQVVNEMEPYLTLRGHTGPVMAISKLA